MLRVLLLLALFSMTALPKASAADMRYTTEYDIRLGALPIAKASFVTQVAKRNYTISGFFRPTGIVDFFTDISAQTSVSGRLSAERFVARRYSLVYTRGKNTRVYDVRYRNGDVIKTTIDPAPDARPDNWIPVTKQDLRAVLDPLSGLIVPEKARICPRTLPIYDGESRMDIVLVPKGVKTMKVNGIEMDTVVCGVRYVPKSGFRADRDDIDYMRKASDIEIRFAKTGTLKVYAPVYARFPTEYGSVHITAVSFGG